MKLSKLRNKNYAAAAAVAATIFCGSAMRVAPAAGVPPIPDPPREYRVAWCATVNLIDWPPRTGISGDRINEQKARLLEHLDMLQANNMNAMYFQVRPAADAMYNSPIEPWSQWLTGSQNTNATWDPLTFAVTEAHKRGIELHAWVNPYRASFDTSTSNKSPKHITRARPDLCLTYGGRKYINPGKADSIKWVSDVVADIVTRYDVDGVVFDDYFYPGSDFPDQATYQTYLTGGGTMNIHDWRRDNVDRLIYECYTRIHGIRNSCQFSVGPFGIWRPGYPEGVSGSDYYSSHYCDTRKWLINGWVDSLSPQLYWPTDSPGQPFGPLINWWAAQNPNRHVMASTAIYRVAVGPDTFGNVWTDKSAQEIVDQVNLTNQAGGVGNVHYSIRWLTDDPNNTNILEALVAGPYAQDALRPASTWLDNIPPPPPVVSMGGSFGSPARRNVYFSQSPGDEKAKWWVVYTYNGTKWDWAVLPGTATHYVAMEPVLEYAVSAVDRSGNESSRAGFTAVSDWSMY